MKTSALRLAAALAFLAAIPAVASAQLEVKGTTASSGICPSTFCSYFTGTTTGLSFTGNTFDVTTFDGFAALSGANRLGVFTQAAGAGALDGHFFMKIMFALPTGIAGGNQSTFEGTVEGSVGPAQDQGGSNIISFAPQTFYLADGGSFTLTVSDTPVTSGRTAELQGTVTASPEPASLTLLATGLVGIFGAARRRRKNVA